LYPQWPTARNESTLISSIEAIVTGWPGGAFTAAHEHADLNKIIEVFREALLMLKR
jgi:hypothetical protein